MGVSKSRNTLTAMLGGSVLDYVEFTGTFNPSGTTEGTATTLVTSNPVTFDGSTQVLVRFSCPLVRPGLDAAGRLLFLVLFDNGTAIGHIGVVRTPAAHNMYVPVDVSRKLTPSAGTHTYAVKAYVSGGTGELYAANGAAGDYVPGYIRITRESTVIGGTGIAGVQGGFAPLDSGLLIPAAYLPQTIRGRVAANGDIDGGTGFSVVRNSTGNYTITFTTAFAAVPVVVLSTGNGLILRSAVSTTAVTVESFNLVGSSIDVAFHFIAMAV